MSSGIDLTQFFRSTREVFRGGSALKNFLGSLKRMKKIALGRKIVLRKKYLEMLKDAKIDLRSIINAEFVDDVKRDPRYVTNVPMDSGDLQDSLEVDVLDADGRLYAAFRMDPVDEQTGLHYARFVDLTHPTHAGFARTVSKIIREMMHARVRDVLAAKGFEMK